MKPNEEAKKIIDDTIQMIDDYEKKLDDMKKVEVKREKRTFIIIGVMILLMIIALYLITI